MVEACCLWQQRLQDRGSLSIRGIGAGPGLELEQFRQDPARDESCDRRHDVAIGTAPTTLIPRCCDVDAAEEGIDYAMPVIVDGT